jgi:predicted ATPase/DNA-binding CsgD family transcriptional regulator
MVRIVTGLAAVAATGVLHGFAPALTSFIGRESEAQRAAGLLDEYRLVTVTGPGGVGKTRLAAEVARRTAVRFADGAWLAELGPVTDAAQVPAAVAAALGIRQAPGLPLADQIAAALAPQQVLLVLDNCEQVGGAAAELCRSLLTAVDDLTVLATSREPIRVAGEARYRLRPLPVPDGPDRAGPAESAAVALFADRARQADPEFVLDAQTTPAVARLVARLDGMPLAIELAAARVESLGLSQLLERLEASFGLLAEPGAVPRHQSLAATTQWSYDLLAEADQQVFRRLAIFPGGFTLEGAEAVAGPAAAAVVLHLVDCSLVSPPRPGPDGSSRYLMLETLREFGLVQLAEAGERANADAALAGYALRVARQASAGLRTGAGEVTAARLLDAEDPVIHQALHWALELDRPAALDLAVKLSPWWQMRGRLTAGYALLTAAARAAEPGSETWREAQYWLGRAAANSGDLPASLGHLTAVRDSPRNSRPSPALIDALASRSAALRNLGQGGEEAAGDVREALAMAREIGYPAGEVRALLGLQFEALRKGDTDAVLNWARQAEQVDPAAIPGDLARGCGIFLAGFLLKIGDHAGARQACHDGLTRAREASDLLAESEFLLLGANLETETGQLAEASRRLSETITLAIRISDRMTLIECLDIGARICAAGTRWAEVVTLLTAFTAAADSESLAVPPSDAEKQEKLLRLAAKLLGTARMRAAEQRGTALTLPAAAELAVIAISPVSSPADSETSPPRKALSTREQELIRLIAQGKTDAQIAGQLYISVSTVRSHLDRIRDKTNCRRRADLTRLALRIGVA